jgi:LPXTG-motif cell wall-anchored protein
VKVLPRTVTKHPRHPTTPATPTLPRTGAGDAGPIGLVGLVLVGMGVALMSTGRRRRGRPAR